MKAKAYLSQVRTEYKNVRVVREKLRMEDNAAKRRDLREILKKTSAYYSVILKDVWDLIDQVNPDTCRDNLIRRYVFLEPWDQIAGDLGISVSTVYKQHMKALSAMQKILNAGGEAA